MSQVSFRVNGEQIVFEFDELDIIDMDDLRSKSASSIAYWSSVVADAERDLEIAEAEHANWHGKAMDLAMKAPGPATAEWKAKAAIAAQPESLVRAKRLADARNHVAKAKSVLLGFNKQHDLLKAMTISAATDASRSADIGRTGDDRMRRFKDERATRLKKNQGE